MKLKLTYRKSPPSVRTTLCMGIVLLGWYIAVVLLFNYRLADSVFFWPFDTILFFMLIHSGKLLGALVCFYYAITRYGKSDPQSLRFPWVKRDS